MCKLDISLKNKATVITPKTIAEDVKSIKDKSEPGNVVKLAKPWRK
jgi:hypothetical protein